MNQAYMIYENELSELKGLILFGREHKSGLGILPFS